MPDSNENTKKANLAILQTLFTKVHHLALIKHGNKRDTNINLSDDEFDDSDADQGNSGTKGQLQLLIDDCDLHDLEALSQFIVSLANAESTESDLSQYFSAITDSSMYKPANPQLAIMQVAKAYNLDAQQLKASFKRYRKV